MPDVRVERIANRLIIYDHLGEVGHVEIPQEQEEYILERMKEEVGE